MARGCHCNKRSLTPRTLRRPCDCPDQAPITTSHTVRRSGWRLCLLLAMAGGSPSPSGPRCWWGEPHTWFLPTLWAARAVPRAWRSARAGAWLGLLLVALGRLCDSSVPLYLDRKG